MKTILLSFAEAESRKAMFLSEHLSLKRYQVLFDSRGSLSGSKLPDAFPRVDIFVILQPLELREEQLIAYWEHLILGQCIHPVDTLEMRIIVPVGARRSISHVSGVVPELRVDFSDFDQAIKEVCNFLS